ncbi:glycosyltransferase family 2 protein [Cyanobium usitatum]|uniref:glycosyltransferase family 2 protein n=1 Tax=Cyanobium usitatum TaxID=2304190 RepID=UPI002AD23F00|nr:glycosyltransferase family 2 protein [Cyanobium usitatum]
MKVAAIVGVKDEVELIQPCLERLWAVGVGPILVLDNNSSDGTIDIVDRLSRHSAAPLTRTSFSPDFDQNLQVGGEVIDPFVRQHSPDWLLFIDADEFMVCVNDDLPGALANVTGPVLSIERYNVPLSSDPFVPTAGTEASDFLGIRLITGREDLSRSLLDEPLGKRWIMNRIMPKLICRPDRVSRYGLGWHSIADSRGQPIPSIAAKGLLLVHLPLTTNERFVRKVNNAREFFRHCGEHYPGDAAWHWKRWVDLADRGLLGAEFAAQRMGEAEMAHLADVGAIERADAVLQKSMRTQSG